MKYALVTGVAGGIGGAAAKKLIREGYTVFGLDIKAPAKPIEGLVFIQTDLKSQKSVLAAAKLVRKTTANIDCILHMAGIYELNSLVEMKERDFLYLFDINVFAVFRVNKIFLPFLSQGSRILITSSELAPLRPLPFTGVYGITKTTLEHYAIALRRELMLKGIRVIILRPGAVNTGLLKTSTEKLESFMKNTKHYSCNAERFRKIVDRVESKMVPPEAIAGLSSKALREKKPKSVYNINRNPLLIMLNVIPEKLQDEILMAVLSKRKTENQS